MAEQEKRIQDLRERMAREMNRQTDRQMLKSLGSVTTAGASAAEQKPITAEDIARACHIHAARARRNSVRFRATAFHDGPMLGYTSASDGTTIEISFPQAQAVHNEWPIRLDRVVDEWTAEFVPAGPHDAFIPKILPLPPFALEGDDG